MGGDEISAGYLKQQFIKKYKYFYRIPEFFRFFISLLLSPLNKFSSKSRVFKNLFGIKNEFLFLALKNIDLIDKLKKLPGFHKWSKDIFYDFNGRNFLQEVQNFEFKNHKIPYNKNNVIFICGMPRSGTTLCEQILSSHSNVTGAGELNFLANLTGIGTSVQVKAETLDNLEEIYLKGAPWEK